MMILTRLTAKFLMNEGLSPNGGESEPNSMFAGAGLSTLTALPLRLLVDVQKYAHEWLKVRKNSSCFC
jgi:hypothetical protein